MIISVPQPAAAAVKAAAHQRVLRSMLKGPVVVVAQKESHPKQRHIIIGVTGCSGSVVASRQLLSAGPPSVTAWRGPVSLCVCCVCIHLCICPLHRAESVACWFGARRLVGREGLLCRKGTAAIRAHNSTMHGQG